MNVEEPITDFDEVTTSELIDEDTIVGNTDGIDVINVAIELLTSDSEVVVGVVTIVVPLEAETGLPVSLSDVIVEFGLLNVGLTLLIVVDPFLVSDDDKTTEELALAVELEELVTDAVLLTTSSLDELIRVNDDDLINEVFSDSVTVGMILGMKLLTDSEEFMALDFTNVEVTLTGFEVDTNVELVLDASCVLLVLSLWSGSIIAVSLDEVAMTEDASETEDAVSLSDLIVEFDLLNVGLELLIVADPFLVSDDDRTTEELVFAADFEELTTDVVLPITSSLDNLIRDDDDDLIKEVFSDSVTVGMILGMILLTDSEEFMALDVTNVEVTLTGFEDDIKVDLVLDASCVLLVSSLWSGSIIAVSLDEVAMTEDASETEDADALDSETGDVIDE